MKCIKLLVLLIWVLGWAGACRPFGHPPIEELLIDLSVFPDGWSGDLDGPRPIARAPLGGTKSVQSIEISFYAYGGGAGERIRRFDDSKGAVDEFARQLKLVFRETEFNTSWIIPEELTFESPSANQFHYACSENEGSPWQDCAYLAQFGVYTVHFSTDMLPGYMSYADFENVLQAIDNKMTEYAE